jgi:hypothetical protein
MQTPRLPEGRGNASDFKLVFAETAQVVFADAAISKEVGEDERENGIAKIVTWRRSPVVVSSTSVPSPTFVRPLQPYGPFFGLPNNCVRFPRES